MADDRRGRSLRALAILGLAAAGAFAVVKLRGRRPPSGGREVGLWGRVSQVLDRSVGWYHFPLPVAVLLFAGLRDVLRAQNLYDTGAGSQPPPPAGGDRTRRTIDGTFNDLTQPRMGSANTRFGRNVPVGLTFPDDEPRIMTPSPRKVSLELMTRDTFTPASTLNLLAAAWLQFMIHDWFSHGRSSKENPWQIPLEPGDTWHENPMQILRVADDPTRTADETRTPPTHLNTETHWWDGSQLYGSSETAQRYVRQYRDGHLIVGRDHILNPDEAMIVGQPLLAGWWLGQSLMYTLFALEHNAIADALHAEYPSWSDDDLFQIARLVNAALLAKIHTIEWTPAILGTPALKLAMNANWWGLAGEAIKKLVGRVSSSEVISGILGAKTDHFGVPYAMTEEFVSVYRMHPLIPDDITFRSLADDSVLQRRQFGEIAGTHARERMNEISMQDIFYSFGRMNPGAIQLHNFPKALQQFTRPDGVVVDLAAHDIMRSRELGVPRYNEFRELLHLKPFATFEEMTPNPEWAAEMKRVYDGDVEKVDLTVGLFAEQPPPGFGFSDTAFRIFILMASRRLNSDRFFTTDFTSEVYTPLGMRWIDDNTMSTVLLRHYPALAPALENVQNPFAPWTAVKAPAETLAQRAV